MTTFGRDPEAIILSAPTPGPWRVEAETDSERAVLGTYVRAGLYNVARVFAGPVGEDGTEANARLIAAAPTLLAALQGLIRAVGGTSGDCALCGGGPEPDSPLYEGHHVRCPVADALAALAQAEGRTP